MLGQEVPLEIELAAMAEAIRCTIRAQPNIRIDNLKIFVEDHFLVMKGTTNDARHARLAQTIMEDLAGMTPFRSLILIRDTYH